MGMAYQVQDDILDAIGDRSIMGKNPGMDRNRGVDLNRVTCVTFIGIEQSRELLANLLNDASTLLAGLSIDTSILSSLMQRIVRPNQFSQRPMFATSEV